MKSLQFLIPIIALSSCAAMQQPDERTAPTRFHGEWNSVLADCGTGASDSLLIISRDRIGFYESAGPIRGAFLNGPNEILIVANVTGEEETTRSAFSYTLSADGRSLTQFSESEEPFVRHRCPASRSLPPR
jgi:hypothetical protein